jgi:curli biogenesis system outer membrane secretion channel CsgG
MSKRITCSLLTLLLIVLSACARETPMPPGSVQTPTATPIPSPTATPIPAGETPVAGTCELVANAQTTVYQRPSLNAGIFGTLSPEIEPPSER